jgi:hypothetical protein
MTTSTISIVWANKPDCSKAVAEFWLDERDLWLTLFLDDADGILRMEIFTLPPDTEVCVVDLAHLERAIEMAKRELLGMKAPSSSTNPAE